MTVTMLPQGVLCSQHGEFRSCGNDPECGHRKCMAIHLGHCPRCEQNERELRTHGRDRGPS